MRVAGCLSFSLFLRSSTHEKEKHLGDVQRGTAALGVFTNSVGFSDTQSAKLPESGDFSSPTRGGLKKNFTAQFDVSVCNSKHVRPLPEP